MVNILPKEKQIAIIGMLAERASMRAITRITGIHRVRIGEGCARLLDAKMRDLTCHFLSPCCQDFLCHNYFCHSVRKVPMKDGPTTKNASTIKADEEKQPPRPDFRLSDLPGMLSAVFIVFLIAVVYVSHYYVDEHSAKIKFGVEVVFSFLALLVVIAQAVIYAQQAEFMKQQIAATERNTIYGQRAYVYAKIGEVREDIFDVVLLIENSGNSPANDVIISYKAEFRERDPHKDTGDWDSFHSPRHNPRRIGVLPPKIYFPETIYYRPVPTPDELRKYYVRYWNYHVWGEIHYRDVFKKKWYTSFAFYVTAVGNIKVTVMPGLSGNEVT